MYVFPIIRDDFGINGALRLSALFALIGMLLTLLIPEPARRGLEELSPEDVLAGAEGIVASAEPVPVFALEGADPLEEAAVAVEGTVPRWARDAAQCPSAQ